MLRLLQVFLVFAWGCGGGEVEIPKPQGELVPVKGKVMLGSQPVAGAQVVFVPAKGVGIEARGKTESDGTFELKSGPDSIGAYVGDYNVRVEPPSDPKLAGKKSRPPFPTEYWDESSSGLTASVKAGQSSLEPFVLKSTFSRKSAGKDRLD